MNIRNCESDWALSNELHRFALLMPLSSRITGPSTGTNPPLKRVRSGHVPGIPQIKGDIILEVFTHSSLHGNNERLAERGKTILEAVITRLLFDKRPLLNASEMRVCFALVCALVLLS